MNKIQNILLPVLLMLIALAPKPSFSASAPDPLWNFTTADQMRAEIARYIDKPEASYDIIMRANKLNMSPEAAMAYFNILMQKPTDSNAGAEYVFSYFMSAGPFSSEYFVQHPSPLMAQLRAQGTEEELYRKNLSTLHLPPAAMLEVAVPSYYNAVDPNFSKEVALSETAIERLRQSAQRSPVWAQPHYWLGVVLTSFWPLAWATPSKQFPLCQEAVPELRQAEMLDPGVHVSCLIYYAHAYQGLDQPVQELKYLDAFLKAKPNAAQANGGDLIKWRDALVASIAKKPNYTSHAH